MALPLFILLLLLIKRLVFKGNNHKLNLPPSPLKLPIIGNLHQLGSLPHRSLHSLSLKHGPLMLLHLGQTPTLVVSSPDLIKQIIKSHDITFSNRHQTTPPNIIFHNCRDIGFSQYGEYWRQTRKLCVLGLLSRTRVESFQYIRDEEVKRMIERIDEDGSRQGHVNMREMIRSVVSNVVARCVIGRRGDGGSRFGEVSRRVTVNLVAFCLGDYFPWLGWLDVVSGRVGRIKESCKVLDDLLDQVIEEHMRSFVCHEDDADRKDFLYVLLQFLRNNMLDVELTLNDIKAILMDLFLAGADTVSSTLEWAVSELIKNPDKMKKVQKEIRDMIGNNNKSIINKKDTENMEYLKGVIKETLRLHPPAPFLVPRETSTSIKLGGYDIPEKVTVFINTWAIQRDSTVWDRSHEFIPERYLNNPIDYKGFDSEYIPFGIGRRGCPGMTFGVVTIECVLANLLYLFDWKLFGSQELDMSELNGITISKRFPLVVEATRYFA